MSAGDVATLLVCLAFLGVGFVIALRRARQPSPQCGDCQRVMMSGWDQCQFCGWLRPAQLRFIAGPMTDQILELSEEVTTLGAATTNTVVLADDPGVSRKHVGIRRVDGGYECADLGSTNGVYFNGCRLPKKRLASGDIVRIGSSEMVFLREK